MVDYPYYTMVDYHYNTMVEFRTTHSKAPENLDSGTLFILLHFTYFSPAFSKEGLLRVNTAGILPERQLHIALNHFEMAHVPIK